MDMTSAFVHGFGQGVTALQRDAGACRETHGGGTSAAAPVASDRVTIEGRQVRDRLLVPSGGIAPVGGAGSQPESAAGHATAGEAQGSLPATGSATTQASPDPMLEALAVREKLESLHGPERAAFIQEFREKNAGKIFVSIDLHNHQPIYRPGVHPADTPEIQQYVLGTGDAENRREVYTTADAYAIEAMKDNPGQPHFGIQVSYSGSLMEDLEKTRERGLWPGPGWNERYKDLRATTETSEGNPRLDLVNIGYHHPLMGLIASGHTDGGKVEYDKDIQLQIQMHQRAVEKLFGGPVSKGFFPPEMAFSERMIPALRKVGIDWAMVDNLHFDRANADYNNPGDGLKPPNGADKRNPGTHSYETLPNDLAKTHLVSPEALRPHYAKYVDPATGNEELTIVVPEERSLSSYIQKDRDGGKIAEVIARFQKFNTDPEHPLFVLFATDGDNNGSNSGDFHRNVPIDMATRYPGQVVFTTVQDYLDLFPPKKPEVVTDANGARHYQGGDVIHVEDGAWWGANLGDPQFSKWADDPAWLGYSPKKNSWAVLTAAKNAVLTADQMEPAGASKESIDHIIANQGTDTERAWHDLLVGQTSCYEYWNPDNVLSYSSVQGANQALDNAQKVMARHPREADKVGPSVFLPMHYPYDPRIPAGLPASFHVVTYAHDVNGVSSVRLNYRVDDDGKLDRPQDFMFEGEGVKQWEGRSEMIKRPFPELADKPPVWVEPKVRADEYRAELEIPIPEGRDGAMVQYFVETEDTLGNISRSPIQHVFVSTGSSEPGNVSNEEIHGQLKSGDAATMAGAILFVLNSGRNDVNVFNHVFFRLENADAALIGRLEGDAAKGRLALSPEPRFRDEYVTRLDKHLEKATNLAMLKASPSLARAMAEPLAGQASDPRVARILSKLEVTKP